MSEVPLYSWTSFPRSVDHRGNLGKVQTGLQTLQETDVHFRQPEYPVIAPVSLLAPMHEPSFSLLLSSLKLSDTKVYEPEIRVLLETAAHVLYMHER